MKTFTYNIKSIEVLGASSAVTEHGDDRRNLLRFVNTMSDLLIKYKPQLEKLTQEDGDGSAVSILFFMLAFSLFVRYPICRVWTN